MKFEKTIVILVGIICQILIITVVLIATEQLTGISKFIMLMVIPIFFIGLCLCVYEIYKPNRKKTQ